MHHQHAALAAARHDVPTCALQRELSHLSSFASFRLRSTWARSVVISACRAWYGLNRARVKCMVAIIFSTFSRCSSNSLIFCLSLSLRHRIGRSIISCHKYSAIRNLFIHKLPHLRRYSKGTMDESFLALNIHTYILLLLGQRSFWTHIYCILHTTAWPKSSWCTRKLILHSNNACGIYLYAYCTEERQRHSVVQCTHACVRHSVVQCTHACVDNRVPE